MGEGNKSNKEVRKREFGDLRDHIPGKKKKKKRLRPNPIETKKSFAIKPFLESDISDQDYSECHAKLSAPRTQWDAMLQ